MIILLTRMLWQYFLCWIRLVTPVFVTMELRQFSLPGNLPKIWNLEKK